MDSDAEFQARVVARVMSDRATVGVPSLLLATGRAGAPVIRAVSGLADVEHKVAATEESAYRIGSITKTFAAALVLSLAEAGELRLDEPVRRFLPSLPFSHVSPRQLLSHTSGLQREAPTDMWESMRGPSRDELHDAFSTAEFVADPGQRWHYSNLGYAVLGQVIETIVGGSYESAITDSLLRPLGLEHTSWREPPGAAVGYRMDPFNPTVHREPVMDQGAIGVGGQMWSTAADLLRWSGALCGGRPDVLSGSVVDRMHALHVMVDASRWTRGWGLGLILSRHRNIVFSGHTGAMPGFQAALALDRSTGVAVVVLVNVTRGFVPADLASETLCQAVAAQPVSPAPVRPATPCPPEVVPLLGSWWSEADETVLRWENDGLHACLASAPADTDTRFSEVGPGRFRAVEGRLQGELLVVVETPRGREMRWATYPFTRSPR